MLRHARGSVRQWLLRYSMKLAIGVPGRMMRSSSTQPWLRCSTVTGAQSWTARTGARTRSIRSVRLMRGRPLVVSQGGIRHMSDLPQRGEV